MELICPVCKGPTKPLATSRYCPKDCDKKSKSGDSAIIIAKNGQKWEMMCQDPHEEIPEKAINTWQLCNDDEKLSNSNLPWAELVKNWQALVSSGHSVGVRRQAPSRHKRLVFWPIK